MSNLIKGVSIVICCYNSAEKLPQTLKHISEQKLPDWLKCEVLIIDNNSKDNTAEIAQREWDNYSLKIDFSIIKERRPGLSFARSSGIENAQYEIVIFCDDDNWLDDNYVKNAYDLMINDSTIGIIGGVNIAVADVEFPSWFEEFKGEYACGAQGEKDGFTDRLFIWGAGMVIRKKIFDMLREKSIISQLSDRKGAELSSGGDSEICFGAIILGYKLFFSSSLQLKHYMSQDRLEWKYLLKLMNGHAKACYKLIYYWDIIRGNKYDITWQTSLLNRTKALFPKIINVIYHYLKANLLITDKYSLSRVSDLQIWIEHIKMRKNYGGFINYLEYIEKNKNI